MPTTLTDDPIDIIEQEAAAVAVCFGVEASRDLAAALVDRLTHRLAGTSVYIARERPRAKINRNDDIRARFNGANAHELARLHGITPRQVRRIANG